MDINKLNKDTYIYLCLFIYACAYIFVASTSSPLYTFNYRVDPNVYFVMGRGMFQNVSIYKDLFDHKGPLLYFIFGIGSLISRTTFIGIYWLECLNLFVCLLFAYKLSGLFLNRKAPLFAVLLFAPLLLVNLEEGGSAEEFTLPFIMISIYLYVKYFKSGQSIHPPRYMFIHGLMVMSVVLIKINLIILWAVLMPCICLQIIWCKHYKNLVHNILFFVLGMLVFALPFGIYFYLKDSFADFYQSYIQFNRMYSQVTGLTIKGFAYCLHQRLLFNTGSFLVILGGISIFCVSKSYISSKLGRLGLGASFVILFIYIYATGRGYEYYYLPVCIFGIFSCILLLKKLEQKVFLQDWKVYVAGALLCLFLGLQYNGVILLKAKQERVQDVIAKIILNDPDPSLFVCSADLNRICHQGMTVYTKTGITPNIKYFYHPVLDLETGSEINKMQLSYITERKVKFLVVAIDKVCGATVPSVIEDNYDMILERECAPVGRYNYGSLILYKAKTF